MNDIKANPLKMIFLQISPGKYSAEKIEIKNINYFFIYLKEPKNNQE